MMNINSETLTDRELLEKVGERLRALRKARKLTVTEVSSRAGLNRTTVHRAEAGDNPTLLTVIRLLRVYGRLEALAEFLPPAEVSPMELVRQGRKLTRG